MKKYDVAGQFCIFLLGVFFASTVFSEQMTAENSQLSGKKFHTLDNRSQLYKTLHWSKDCEDNFRAGGFDPQKDAGITKYPLGPQKWLIYYFFDIKQKKTHLIEFKTIDLGENNQPIIEKTTELAGEPSFLNGKLTMFSKARGAGGCGSQIIYGFKEGQSHIIQARARSCDASMDKDGQFVDPANWPILNF
jgi:hypothetical protein